MIERPRKSEIPPTPELIERLEKVMLLEQSQKETGRRWSLKVDFPYVLGRTPESDEDNVSLEWEEESQGRLNFGFTVRGEKKTEIWRWSKRIGKNGAVSFYLEELLLLDSVAKLSMAPLLLANASVVDGELASVAQSFQTCLTLKRGKKPPPGFKYLFRLFSSPNQEIVLKGLLSFFEI